ncbi:proton atpase, partial [Cystoisospora suis]
SPRGGFDQQGTVSSGEGRSRHGSFRKRVSGCGAAAVAAFSSCASGEHVRSNSLRNLRRSKTISLSESGQQTVGAHLEYSVENEEGKRRVEWVDEASGFAFREFSLDPPQYDASSPDELCLISACNFFGLEFASRPSLMDIELEFTSTFMIELLLRWKQEAEARASKRVLGRTSDQGECGGGEPGLSSVPGFPDMTERLLLKQLERAHKIILGQQHQGYAA